MEATCNAIRSHGVIPGLWFEFEVAGSCSTLWNRDDLLLHRDGVPVQAGSRRFLDMRKQECHDYLESRVLNLIDRCGIGYVKIDYNETVGIGVDGAESPGEGLRQHILGVYRFLDRMKQRFPELVVENCSSGGQRMEISMIQRCAMTSFSDAHETVSIPVIAANLNHMTLPRLLQIWAVLRSGDTIQRLIYSLSATFLGRMCLSGNLSDLNKEQRQTVKKAVEFYRNVSDTIKNGRSIRFGPGVASYNNPKGWQAVVRYCTEDKQTALIVVHSFKDAPESIVIPVEKAFRIANINIFALPEVTADISGSAITISGITCFSGCVIKLSNATK